MRTLAEQLESVDAAIVKAEAMQSGSSDGRSWARADLVTLYERRDRLQRDLNIQNNRGRGSLVRVRREP